MTTPRILLANATWASAPAEVQYLRVARDYIEGVAKRSGHNRQRRTLCSQAVDAINAALRTFGEGR